MSGACRRIAEVEAARDGRLDARAQAAFREHVGQCVDCAREQAQLDALQAALVENEAPVSQAHLFALRERVVSSAHAMGTFAARSERNRRWAVVAMGAAAAVSLGYFAARTLAPAARDSLVVQTGPGGAQWTRRRTPQADVIDLREGTLHVDVRHRSGDPRVVVRVPDGEIEDVGTVFFVTVQGGRTAELAVSEGRVVFKRPAAAPMTLSAGMRWQAPASAPQAAPLVAGQVVPATRAEPHDAGAPSHVRRSHPHQESVAQQAALEDAAYLQFVALVREQREAEARVAATKYLRSFPNGFRRKEVGDALSTLDRPRSTPRGTNP